MSGWTETDKRVTCISLYVGATLLGFLVALMGSLYSSRPPDEDQLIVHLEYPGGSLVLTPTGVGPTTSASGPTRSLTVISSRRRSGWQRWDEADANRPAWRVGPASVVAPRAHVGGG